VSGANSPNPDEGGPGATQSSVPKDHSHAVTLSVSSGSAGDPESVTFVLIRKILGQMRDYNSAITTPNTEGMWESPAANINAETLKIIEWNSTEVGSDTLNVYTRTASTQALVEDATACTADFTTDFFTSASHGLIDTDRIRIGGTAVPTGVNGNIMYYVVNSTASTFQISLTSGGAAVNYSDNGTAVTFKKWVLESDGTTVQSVANVWFQYLFAFTATDTTVSNPRAFSSDAFVFRFFYEKGGVIAENAVEFIYDTGFINFNQPFEDKIYDKINTWHEGEGTFDFTWETEHSTGSMNIDMDVAPTMKRWDSFFQDDAMGRRFRAKVTKNDLLPLVLKEMSGLYVSEPNII
jgi:hypothetical protein